MEARLEPGSFMTKKRLAQDPLFIFHPISGIHCLMILEMRQLLPLLNHFLKPTFFENAFKFSDHFLRCYVLLFHFLFLFLI